MTKGEEDGLFKKYYTNGVIERTGWVINGSDQGVWYNYRPDSSLARIDYYKDGQLYGNQWVCDTKGRTYRKTTYDMNGVFIGHIFYDTTGNVESKCLVPNGTGLFKEVYASNKVRYEGNYVHGSGEGLFNYYYISGQKMSQDTYIADERTGIHQEFFEDGKLRIKSNYVAGSLNGKYEKFYENGKKDEEEDMVDGEVEGKEVTYYENGKVLREAWYTEGTFNGMVTVYDEQGGVMYKREYAAGELIRFYYMDQTKKMVTADVKDGTIDVIGYYANGLKAVELHLKNGEFVNVYKKFYTTGKLMESEEYEDGERKGEIVSYYPNGNKKSVVPYKLGEMDGLTHEYYENGAIHIERSYKYGDLQGWTFYYNTLGKLVRKVWYSDGTAVQEIIVSK
jgi:antitoxin component YwqK of YwqJK toxin-antitoxin module